MTEKRTQTRTYYVFTQEVQDKDYWVGVEMVEAGAADEAVRKTAKQPGLYVAVPERSFKPIRVEAVTVTQLKLTVEEGPLE